MANTDTTPATGYVALVRTNVNFRRLWLGNVISLFGDWFNTIALYRTVETISGSALALGRTLGQQRQLAHLG